jgi:hypothetical protein
MDQTTELSNGGSFYTTFGNINTAIQQGSQTMGALINTIGTAQQTFGSSTTSPTGTSGTAPIYYAPQPKESWLQKNKKMVMLGAGLLLAAVAAWYLIKK